MNNIERFCRKIEMPEEECEVLGAAYLKIVENKSAYGVFEECVSVYKQNTVFDRGPIFEKIEGLSEKTGIHKYTLDLVYLIMLVPHMKVMYEENGLTEEVFNDSVLDLKWKSEECKSVTLRYSAVYHGRKEKRGVHTVCSAVFHLCAARSGVCSIFRLLGVQGIFCGRFGRRESLLSYFFFCCNIYSVGLVLWV